MRTVSSLPLLFASCTVRRSMAVPTSTSTTSWRSAPLLSETPLHSGAGVRRLQGAAGGVETILHSAALDATHRRLKMKSCSGDAPPQRPRSASVFRSIVARNQSSSSGSLLWPRRLAKYLRAVQSSGIIYLQSNDRSTIVIRPQQATYTRRSHAHAVIMAWQAVLPSERARTSKPAPAWGGAGAAGRPANQIRRWRT